MSYSYIIENGWDEGEFGDIRLDSPMGNKIIDFSYRVRGDFSPNGLQKVFFSFYPGDTVRMEKIADDILIYRTARSGTIQIR